MGRADSVGRSPRCSGICEIRLLKSSFGRGIAMPDSGGVGRPRRCLSEQISHDEPLAAFASIVQPGSAKNDLIALAVRYGRQESEIALWLGGRARETQAATSFRQLRCQLCPCTREGQRLLDLNLILDAPQPDRKSVV